MQKIKIGIVEDEVIIADTICATLEELGYLVPEACVSYDEAIEMLTKEKPDLLLLDINLGKGRNGLNIAHYLKEHHNIPFIFLTANSDASTLEQAKQLKPNAYLLKPFRKNDLYAAIEVALFNFNDTRSPVVPEKKAPDEKTNLVGNSLFIKDGHYFHKVNFDDILYLSSDHNYVTVHTIHKKKLLVRATIQEYLERFDQSRFVRVHRSYAVNMDKVDKINLAYVIIYGEEVPISKNYRTTLLARLNIR